MNDFGDADDLGVGQLGEDGEAEAFAGRFFGDGEVTLFVAEAGVALLEVQGNGVVQSTADFVGFEVLFEVITARVTDDVEVVAAFGACGFNRELQRGVGKKFVVAMSDTAATLCPSVEVFEFDSENAALNAFHAVIVADFVVVIADGGAVFAQGSSAGGLGGVVHDERTAFATCAKVLAGIEAESGHEAEGACDLAVVFRAVGLGRVFDQGDIVFLTNRKQRVHIAGVAVEMNRHEGFGARGDGLFDALGVDAAGLVVDININRTGTDVGNGPACGNKGLGRGNNFIARTDVKNAQSDMERGGAAVKTDSVLCAAESGEVFLKLRDVRPEAVGAVVEGFGNHGIDFFAQRTQLGRQVEVRNWCCHLNGIVLTEVNEENKGKTEG